jgi:transposase
LYVIAVTSVVYVDESGVNRYYKRAYARAKRGKKIHDTKRGKRFKRTNIIAGLSGGKHVAVQCYEHSTTSAFFEDWFEFELLAVIPEGSLIVMDNASFHRKSYLFNIADRYGVYLLFLPAYSPDYNPIEKSWANFKRWLCDNLWRFPCLDIAADVYFSDYGSYVD